MTNAKINDGNNWHFEKRTDIANAFNTWYTDYNLPTSVTFSVNVLADNSKVKEYLANNVGKTGEDIPVGVKVTYPSGNPETKTAFMPTIFLLKTELVQAKSFKVYKW